VLDQKGILQQVQQSDPDATDTLITIRGHLLRYCEFLCGSHHEAEDVVQMTLLKALPILQGNKEHPNVSALLRRIAKNTWLDNVRKRDKCDLQSPAQLSALTDYVQPEERFEVEAALRLLMRRLTSRQRIVFLLCEVFEYTDREAAELLGTSRGAIKAMLHRARASLNTIPACKDSSSDTEDEQKEILKAYVAAFYAADIRAFIHLCQDDTLDPVLATSKVLRFAQRQISESQKSSDMEMSFLAAA
jgi:RNA polymerase sigma factor (sigma-70 family)